MNIKKVLKRVNSCNEELIAHTLEKGGKGGLLTHRKLNRAFSVVGTSCKCLQVQYKFDEDLGSGEVGHHRDEKNLQLGLEWLGMLSSRSFILSMKCCNSNASIEF